ncbi:hypothetical protein RB195_004888 [Necator americanus]|uniref:Integrase catalytic domain-containing protein n=1 Tax=Necator americanus TaxID=51031 RepID=A0ABR1BM47_NECAM
MSVQPQDQDGTIPEGGQINEGKDEIQHQQEQDSIYVGDSVHRDFSEMSNEIIEVIAADDLMTEAVEEVGELDEGRQYLYEYDSMVHTQHDQNIIFQLYQPLETANGMFVCRICLELGDTVEFDNKASYTHHRYKVHGSYNNNHVCPVLQCREIYASMIVLRKHLLIDHKLPIEMHHRTFANIGEFERFRHLVESICNCRFMMHTKQPHNKRQIMHCSKSEHKLILQSRRHKLPQVRMMKEGAWCPAQISFKIDPKTGRVDAFYQLFHYGHAKEYRSIQDDDLDSVDSLTPFGPVDVVFPEPADCPADRPMQYLQIDLISADSCVYVNTVYSHLLIMTDVKTGYMFAKPIPEMGMRQLLIRILTDIFLQFGMPEGFCCGHSVTLIRDVMNAVANIFRVTLKEILYDKNSSSFVTSDHNTFLRVLYEQSTFELQSKHRWVEMVQFTTMVLNQTGKKSPFERMFNRKPYNLPDHRIAPWLLGEELSVGEEDGHIDVEFDEQLDVNVESNEDQYRAPPPRFEVGEKVYLRNFDVVPGRGNTLPYLYGYIGGIDWENSPHFPYRVHFSKSKDPWPNEGSVSAWVNPYDILPISYGLLMMPDEERARAAASLLCSCDGGEFGIPCPLFRSYLCANGMSKACCINSQKMCEYHEECADGDDTYSRMESLSKSFTENHTRNKSRRRIPHLTPANTILPGEQDCAVEMPLLTSESTASKLKRKRTEQDLICSLPEVSTIVVENENRTLVPAISKKTDSQIGKIASEETKGDAIAHELDATTSDEKSPLSKRRRPQEKVTVEKPLSIEQKSLASLPQLDYTSKPRMRRSVRSCKTKVFEDYVPIP